MLERASGELSLAQYRVLASIAAGDERASRIAERLALGKPAISATVESLRVRGLLSRSGVDADQRAAALRLTEPGRRTLDEVERAMTERLARVVELAPDPERLVQALVWLDAAIDEMLAARDAGRGRR
jgi:DNA-binding MarR family transcriptional regulator